MSETATPAYRPIEDYAIIGDCGSAALISTCGSIDWLCWPRFDSPSIFAALLDARRGGRFQICPAGHYEVKRHYAEHTNVLQTTFTTTGGTLRLTDLMPVAAPEAYQTELWPEHEVLRCVECLAGEVEVQVTCDPCPGYGRLRPRPTRRGALGYFYTHRSEVLVLRSEVPLEPSERSGALCGTVGLRQGERRSLSLTYGRNEPALLPLLGAHAARKIGRSRRYWRQWAGRCQYDGAYQDAVVRSALTLKLMIYAPSGAIIAAPTTSLPEVVGGKKNWDYRYCWLRDSAFVLRALFELGYKREGGAFFSWLLQATRRTFPRLNTLYNVYGGTGVTEQELDALEGYKGSRPVRLGNQAEQQFQLDVYGELVSATFEFAKREGQMDALQRKQLRKLGDTLCDLWQEPDNGIWEIRGARHDHTYSKAMCWIGLDRLKQLHEHGFLDAAPGRWDAVQQNIRAAIEQDGFNEELGSYASVLGGDRLDASLLLLSIYGYADASGKRMQGTYRCIEKYLGADGLLYRFGGDDRGDRPDEGTFGICSFWAVEHLAKAGRVEEARRRFEDVLSYANDVGLLPEEIHPESGAALGNFPQAFTHVGLINAALTLADASEGRSAHSALDESLSGTASRAPTARPSSSR